MFEFYSVIFTFFNSHVTAYQCKKKVSNKSFVGGIAFYNKVVPISNQPLPVQPMIDTRYCNQNVTACSASVAMFESLQREKKEREGEGEREIRTTTIVINYYEMKEAQRMHMQRKVK